MKVRVWDTYVERTDGKTMHFDILAPENVDSPEQIYAYGKSYLKLKGQEGQTLDASECKFCHIEQASEEIVKSIAKQGFHIIEMQNCN